MTSGSTSFISLDGIESNKHVVGLADLTSSVVDKVHRSST